MLITGKKNFVGYWDKILHQSGVENGHSNEKITEKTSLFFSSKARMRDELMLRSCLSSNFHTFLSQNLPKNVSIFFLVK